MTGLTIACAVDLSDGSRRALHYAGALAGHFGARLVVVNVDQPGLDRGAHDGHVEAERRHRLVDFVSSEIEFVTWRGRSVDFALLNGEPGLEIIRFVRSGNVDLLVMGTRGRTGVETAFLGSTTEHALRRSPIPVLAVPLAESGITAPLIRSGPVVVPVDFSVPSILAAQIGQGIADALSVPLLLIHVLQPPGAGAARQVPDNEADARRLLGDLSQSLGGTIGVEAVIREGSRRAEIAQAALERSASVIVMSLKGQPAPIGGSRPGVVAYGVMCLAPVPVLAVPPAAWHAFSHGPGENTPETNAL